MNLRHILDIFGQSSTVQTLPKGIDTIMFSEFFSKISSLFKGEKTKVYIQFFEANGKFRSIFGIFYCNLLNIAD